MEEQNEQDSSVAQNSFITKKPSVRFKKIIFGVIAVILVFGLGLTGYLYMEEKNTSKNLNSEISDLNGQLSSLKNEPISQNQEKIIESSEDVTNIYDELNWKTHTDEGLGLSFRYPSGWFVEEKSLSEKDPAVSKKIIYVDDSPYGEEYEGGNYLTIEIYESKNAKDLVNKLNSKQYFDGKCKFVDSFVGDKKARSATCKGEYGTTVSYGIDVNDRTVIISHCTIACGWDSISMPVNYRMIVESIKYI